MGRPKPGFRLVTLKTSVEPHDRSQTGGLTWCECDKEVAVRGGEAPHKYSINSGDSNY